MWLALSLANCSSVCVVLRPGVPFPILFQRQNIRARRWMSDSGRELRSQGVRAAHAVAGGVDSGVAIVLVVVDDVMVLLMTSCCC